MSPKNPPRGRAERGFSTRTSNEPAAGENSDAWWGATNTALTSFELMRPILDERLPKDGEVDREILALVATGEVRRGGMRRSDAAVREGGGIEFRGLAGLLA